MEKENVARFVACLSRFEERTFHFSKDLSEKVEGQFAKAVLLYIGYNSLKNSTILQGIASGISKLEISSKDCEKTLGDTGKIISYLSEEISKTKKVNDKELGSLADKMLMVCTITLAQLRTLSLMASKISEWYNVDLQNLQGVFELLTRDDEINIELLTKLQRLFLQKEEKTDNMTQAPEVRYQKPENWNTPTHWNKIR